VLSQLALEPMRMNASAPLIQLLVVIATQMNANVTQAQQTLT
jgi:hypothetical protein